MVTPYSHEHKMQPVKEKRANAAALQENCYDVLLSRNSPAKGVALQQHIRTLTSVSAQAEHIVRVCCADRACEEEVHAFARSTDVLWIEPATPKPKVHAVS